MGQLAYVRHLPLPPLVLYLLVGFWFLLIESLSLAASLWQLLVMAPRSWQYFSDVSFSEVSWPWWFLLIDLLVADPSCRAFYRLSLATARLRSFASSRSHAHRLFSLSIGLWMHSKVWVLTYALVLALVVVRLWYGIVQVHPVSM